jgi:hypothetical protein
MADDLSSPNTRDRKLGKLLWVFTVALLAGSSVLNILLAGKTRQLRGAIATMKAEAGLKVGSHMPALVGEDLTGSKATIRFEESDRPTLLYVFTPACTWCKRNEQNLNSLLSQSSGRFRPVALSLSPLGLEDYVKKNLANVPVYTNLEPKTTDVYRFGGTPETLLIDRDGTLLKVWKGAYSGDTLKEVEEYFNVKLPGLTERL